MAFKPEDHLMKLKGSDYLPAVWRVVWFRDEHPDGQIETEVVFWDHDKQEIMVRATVLAPKTGARASAHCVCSLAEFKNGYCEKAETQAVGRALALLGYGTALAGQDLDEGERPADAPTTVAKNGAGASPAKAPAESQSRASQSWTVVEPLPAAAAPGIGAAAWTQKHLGARVRELAGVTLPKLANWQDLARTYGLPVPAQPGDMTQEWLLGLYQAMQVRALEERIRQAPTEGEVRTVMMEAIGLRDRREISMEQYGALDEQADARYAQLAAPSPEEHDLDHEGVALEGDAGVPSGERAKALGRRIGGARSEEEIAVVLRASQQAKDEGLITQDHRVALLRMADTRRAALSGPLTANAV